MADYEKMWEDLGMDVKNHDNLCQVLPTAEKPGQFLQMTQFTWKTQMRS